MEESSPLVDQVAVYESTLRRGAGARAAAGGDRALTDLHQVIRARRARRAAPGVGQPARSALAERAAVGDVAATGGDRPGRILAIEQYGPTVRVFRVGRPAGFTFRAGQYLKLGVPGGKLEDFSVASAPHEPHIDLAIELREGGRVTPALFGLRVGDPVEIGPNPKGKLQLHAAADHHLMVATVTGIAPLRSMLLEALRRGSADRFTILHGASYANELPFLDELAALAGEHDRIRYVPTVSRPAEAENRSWTGATGRVDPLARMAAGGLDPATTHVYAVGNAGMIKAVERDLGGAGFAVSTESYGG